MNSMDVSQALGTAPPHSRPDYPPTAQPPTSKRVLPTDEPMAAEDTDEDAEFNQNGPILLKFVNQRQHPGNDHAPDWQDRANVGL